MLGVKIIASVIQIAVNIKDTRESILARELYGFFPSNSVEFFAMFNATMDRGNSSNPTRESFHAKRDSFFCL